MNHGFLTLSILFICFSSYSQTLHPTSNDPGCCSEKTALPYTFNPDESKVFFQLYVSNKTSEKEVFYEGKYDPWKENKDNHLYSQTYLIPPGSLPISVGKFLDQTEVANIHYQEFLFHITKDSAKYVDRAYYPQIDNKFKTKYFLNPEFYFYPVVGVTYENAQAYCDWRAEKLNEGLKEMLAKQIKKYRYSGRLPNEKEWKNMTGAPETVVLDKYYTFGKKETAFFEEDIVSSRFATDALLKKNDYYGYNHNFKVDGTIGLEVEIPFYIYSFSPTASGFYNVYGNVKELVEEGYAIGGSFLTEFSADELFYPDETQAYRTDVGFRCLTEVARRK
ncbi:hypothetical protein BFP72_11835 [Reichenbachiella sp. 5M10]|uniref:formylglycine-generating enzyme family protein n=1 Tax=Reichenbachiella sp. 5M10 TaxID=1889772 RepID=UPI000C15E8CD|nr:SUMF1/EgtB/PvdO family nonheme iron enzyme [Reichenbachiella sp. 5M10]PIB36037.1 hypothetical protein BFP72_11835 [Reichenbachiella sp. 5M10]